MGMSACSRKAKAFSCKVGGITRFMLLWRLPFEGINLLGAHIPQHERIIVWCQRMPPAKSTCRSKILQTQDFLRPVITDSNTKDASVTTGICKEIDIFSISRPTLKACVQAWSLLRPLLCCDIKQH